MPDTEPFRAPARRPLPPPAWVLPESGEPPDHPASTFRYQPGLRDSSAAPVFGATPGVRDWPARAEAPGRRDSSDRVDQPAGAGPADEPELLPPLTAAGAAAEPDPLPPLTGAGAFGGDGGRFGIRAFDPGRRGVRALAAVAVVVMIVAAVLAWRSRPRVDSVAPPSFEVTEPSPGERPAAGGASSAAAEVVVAVGGKVRKPGLVRLAPGARVADALTAAGGAEPGVDVALLNPARKVVDGELILVGVTPPPGLAVPTGPAAPAGGGPAAGGLVNLNTATLADLDGLPGVGAVLAQRILDARDAQGGFRSVGDLRKVDGIGDARYGQLKDLVTV